MNNLTTTYLIGLGYSNLDLAVLLCRVWGSKAVTGEVTSSVLGAILEQASKNILEKLQKGKKLTLKDLVFLWLDLVYNRVDKLGEKTRRLGGSPARTIGGLKRKLRL